jgi:hypothetical protein
MRPSKKLRIPSASLLLLICTLHMAPRAAAQVSCVVTYNCRSSQCAAAVGGPRTLNYPNEQACIDAAKTVGDGKIASCSCGSPAASAAGASTAVAPVAPGHEFDNTIHQAVAAGIAGKVSPGNAVGLIGSAAQRPSACILRVPPWRAYWIWRGRSGNGAPTASMIRAGRSLQPAGTFGRCAVDPGSKVRVLRVRPSAAGTCRPTAVGAWAFE